MEYAAVFLAMVVTDFIWAKYTAEIADRRALRASLWAMGIIMLGSFVTRAYVDNWRMILPAAAGAFVGTWVSMYWGKRDGR